MLKRVYIKKWIVSVLIAIFCMTLFSCSDSQESIAPGLVTLKVTLPQEEVYDMNSPASRTGNPVQGEGDESKISFLKFFIFNGSTNALEEYRSISIADNGTSTDPMWDSNTRTLRITVTQGQKKIYCLANWTDNNVDGMPAITNSITTIAGLTSQIRNHGLTNPVLNNPPVMTGYLEKNIVGDEPGLTIPLRRQIARVELSFKLSDALIAGSSTADIKIKGVKFLRLPSSSYVFPQTPVGSPVGTPWSQTTFTGVESEKLTGSLVSYATKYYIPENVPSMANATTMVISAIYNGTQTYYSIVINPALSSNYPHAAYVIERNHTYQYTITVEGIGDANAPTRSSISGNTGISYQLEIK